MAQAKAKCLYCCGGFVSMHPTQKFCGARENSARPRLCKDRHHNRERLAPITCRMPAPASRNDDGFYDWRHPFDLEA